MLDTATDAAFLRTILADPDDDAPRLIYADWIDEQGDADRAEFIRLQIRLARMSYSDPEASGVHMRAEELRHAHHVEWMEQLPQFEHVQWQVFHRGFISAVRFDHPDEYQAHAREIFSAAPVRELRLHQFYPKEAMMLATSGYLRRVRVLDMSDGNSIGNTGVEALMDSPHLRDLAVLKLARNSFGSAGVRAIAQSSHVRKLRELRIERNELYDDGLFHLASSPAMAKLVRLDLSRTLTGDDAVVALSRSKYLTHLEWLDLSYNSLSDRGIVALAESNALKELRDFFLQGNSITDLGVAALVDTPSIARLERLFLRQNRIRDKGASALVRSPYLEQLRELYLGGNGISDQAADEVRGRFRASVIVD
jgi:uncharacterized protein (TIGR02996 family)